MNVKSGKQQTGSRLCIAPKAEKVRVSLYYLITQQISAISALFRFRRCKLRFRSAHDTGKKIVSRFLCASLSYSPSSSRRYSPFFCSLSLSVSNEFRSSQSRRHTATSNDHDRCCCCCCRTLRHCNVSHGCHDNSRSATATGILFSSNSHLRCSRRWIRLRQLMRLQLDNRSLGPAVGIHSPISQGAHRRRAKHPAKHGQRCVPREIAPCLLS